MTYFWAHSLWPTQWSSVESCRAGPRTPPSWRGGNGVHGKTCKHHLPQSQTGDPVQRDRSGIKQMYFPQETIKSFFFKYSSFLQTQGYLKVVNPPREEVNHFLIAIQVKIKTWQQQQNNNMTTTTTTHTHTHPIILPSFSPSCFFVHNKAYTVFIYYMQWYYLNDRTMFHWISPVPHLSVIQSATITRIAPYFPAETFSLWDVMVKLLDWYEVLRKSQPMGCR